MTIRISSIERAVLDGNSLWLVGLKSILGQGTYGQVKTGPNGRGLYWNRLDLKDRELLALARFHAHPGLTAEQVVHRIAACLNAAGWGDEEFQDYVSITSGDRVATTRLKWVTS